VEASGAKAGGINPAKERQVGGDCKGSKVLILFDPVIQRVAIFEPTVSLPLPSEGHLTIFYFLRISFCDEK
jgi:hypothetical protein